MLHDLESRRRDVEAITARQQELDNPVALLIRGRLLFDAGGVGDDQDFRSGNHAALGVDYPSAHGRADLLGMKHDGGGTGQAG